MAKISLTELKQERPFTQKIIVRIQGNMNTMWHPNDVISVGSFTSYPFQSWYDVGKGYYTTSCG